MLTNIKDVGLRSRMSGENDAKPDELTLRLMCLLNSKMDDEQLKRMHESRKGCTRAEVAEYVRLWELTEGVGVGPAYVRERDGPD